MAVPHISLDDVVDHLDSDRPASTPVHLLLAAAVTVVAVIDGTAEGTDVAVLLWVPVVAGAALAGLRLEALGAVVLAVAVGVATMPDGATPGIVAAEAAGRALALAGAIVAAGWVTGAARELTRRSRVDGATGLLNATAFGTVLERERQRAVRTGTPISLVYLDLDGLKEVNDRLGHAAGDALLVRFARRIEACRRTVDVAARLGGDEFALLLPATDAHGTTRLLARLCRSGSHGDRCVPVSAGAVCWADPPSAEEMLRRADEVMYRVKRGGGRSWTVVDLGTVANRPDAAAR